MLRDLRLTKASLRQLGGPSAVPHEQIDQLGATASRKIQQQLMRERAQVEPRLAADRRPKEVIRSTTAVSDDELPVDVSVIIPYFQKQSTIERCVKSIVFSQLNAEIVVVDDGSDPALTLEAVAPHAAHRLTLISMVNRGPGWARNVGAEFATGAYLVFLDADDCLDSSFERHILPQIGQRVDLVVGAFKYISHERKRRPFLDREEVDGATSVLRPSELTLDEFRQALDFFAAGAVAVKRSRFDETLGYFDRSKAMFGEDAFLWFQVLLRVETIHRVDAVLVHVDDRFSELGVGRRRRPASALARCDASLFGTACRTKDMSFVESFLRRYRRQAIRRSIWAGQVGEFAWFALRFPRDALSGEMLLYLVKRLVSYGRSKVRASGGWGNRRAAVSAAFRRRP